MKKFIMLLLALLAVTTFGCNDDNGTNDTIASHEIGDSCEGNYFFYACNSDRTVVVECSEKTNGIVKEYENVLMGHIVLHLTVIFSTVMAIMINAINQAKSRNVAFP